MRVHPGSKQHLTYCLNIHPGESWAEVFDAIQRPALAVARAVAGTAPFGLGLRVGARAVEELDQPFRMADLKQFLSQENLYVFTLNGFPYGRFHAVPVKEQVYEPDWANPLRAQYTERLADLLAELLPEGESGSISTVPVGFAPRLAAPEARRAALENLLVAVHYLDRVRQQTGREIHLGLEPEPACLLETSGEFIQFYEELMRFAGPEQEAVVRRHLGVCFDTCHVALAFEDPAEAWDRFRAAGVRISKVQLSAALQARPTAEARQALAAFVEPVYLHQVRARRRDGTVRAWTDLPEALAEWPADAEEVRVHFHVPLFWESDGPLHSTTSTLTPAFWSRVTDGSCPHLEVETYTFGVCPPALQQRDLVASIAAELEWARTRLSGGL